ncbi:MAG: copper resistance protein CopC [Thermoleophilia bacterium]
MPSTRSTCRAGCAAAITAGLLAVGAATASAHAGVASTTPAAGKTAPTTIRVVSVRFNGGIHSGTLKVTGPGGAKVSVGAGKRNARNVTLLAVRLRSGLAPGRYTVTWKAIAFDGHTQTGAFRFRLVKRGR